MYHNTDDLRIRTQLPLLSPAVVLHELRPTERATEVVTQARKEAARIIAGQDDRLLVIVGPCSVHDTKAAMEYAGLLGQEARKHAADLLVVMRVYFEKPRTTVGWKGLINDPEVDGSFKINDGLRLARRLLADIADGGLPAATEFLDPIVPQYIADLITWAAIGARTTESQTHREMASGLSMPIGYKNATDGSLQIAIDAMHSARTPHSFLGIDQDGATSIIRTAGNPFGHVVLRGGRGRSNYDPESIAEAQAQLRKHGLPEALMVDCSHANSGKQHAKQEEVWQSLVAQRAAGNTAIIGAMVESHLHEGSQPIPKDLTQLRHGVSVTDACIGWETTERMLRHGFEKLAT